MPPRTRSGGAAAIAPAPAASRRRAAAPPSRRGRRTDAADDDAAPFDALAADSDDERRKRGRADDDEDEGVVETAEDKRLRMAKAYIASVAATEQLGDADALAHDALGAALASAAAEAAGHSLRPVADAVTIPGPASPAARYGAARLVRSPAGPVTAVAVSPDGRTVWVVTKGGAALAVDVGAGKVAARLRLDPASAGGGKKGAGAARASSAAAPWARRPGRTVPPRSLLAVAASDDGRLVAAGGGDGSVRVWEVRAALAPGPPPPPLAILAGHRGPISGLAFRPGAAAAGHALFSASLDGSVKLWSPDDGGVSSLVDTLFGHAGPALAVSAAPRAERAATGGADRTARVWKVADGAQLLFRAPGQAVDAVAHVTPTEWVSGGPDGGVALWSQLKKRPAAVVRRAHGGGGGGGGRARAPPPPSSSDEDESEAPAAAPAAPASDPCRSWVGAVAVAAGTDLAASGAGDGAVRLWAVRGCAGGGGGGAGGRRSLDPVGSLPTPPGFVNGLAIARSGALLAAGMGTEPRLGRWGRAGAGAFNGVVLHPLGGGGGGAP